MSARVVCLVGGGISCLTAAQILTRVAKVRSLPLRVVLLESQSRLGGQIRTETFGIPSIGKVIIEAGAEGFVARSKVFPDLSQLSGLSADALVNQQRIADCELSHNELKDEYTIRELDPGVAAARLGFQVPKEDRGRGIRSFRLGMSELVNQISSNLEDVRNDSTVRNIVPCGKTFEIEYDHGDRRDLVRADALILGTPLKFIKTILDPYMLTAHVPDLQHNSHVSVHVLIQANQLCRPIRSFTVPDGLQAKFSGLRAMSFVNEKFPSRCPDGTYLFRFYFRPSNVETLDDHQFWRNAAGKVLMDVFDFKGHVLWDHTAQWKAALPILNSEYLESIREIKENCRVNFNRRLELVGSEVSGAGLEAAASSGLQAANNILDSLF